MVFNVNEQKGTVISVCMQDRLNADCLGAMFEGHSKLVRF